MTLYGRNAAGSGLDGSLLHKHSTGGLEDGVSLSLAPVVAAGGGFGP